MSEILFQAMCCPVPQALKAALDGGIASLARLGADQAAQLWGRLLAAVVVAPADASAPLVPRYDLRYQLNEIEVRLGLVSWDGVVSLWILLSQTSLAGWCFAVACYGQVRFSSLPPLLPLRIITAATCRRGPRTTARRWRLWGCSTRCGAPAGGPAAPSWRMRAAPWRTSPNLCGRSCWAPRSRQARRRAPPGSCWPAGRPAGVLAGRWALGVGRWALGAG